MDNFYLDVLKHEDKHNIDRKCSLVLNQMKENKYMRCKLFNYICQINKDGFWVGMCYQFGYQNCNNKNVKIAIDYYEQAIKKGNKLAYHTLGIIYKFGLYPKPNLDIAIKYFKKGTKKNCPFSQFELAISVDSRQSLELFKMAATNGHVRAMGSLGRLYMTGLYIYYDIEKAYYWFNKNYECGGCMHSQYLTKCEELLKNKCIQKIKDKRYVDAYRICKLCNYQSPVYFLRNILLTEYTKELLKCKNICDDVISIIIEYLLV